MIFLVRHGEASAAWGDHPDPGLSETGKLQAEAVAERLSVMRFSLAITSPMRRCRETAAPFEARMGISARTAPEVSEITTPPGTDDRVVWLRGLMGGNWEQAGKAYLEWREALFTFVSGLPDGTVVFSHFVAINALVGRIQGDPRVLVFNPGHCSVTRLERGQSGLQLAEYGNQAQTRVL